MKYSIAIFLFLFFWHVDAAQPTQIAYICPSDSTWGVDFVSLLGSHGLSAKLIQLRNVSSTDFSSYSLIIVDAQTSFGYLWGDSVSVATIKKSGKPVLGLGFGGAGVFQQMGLSINWGNGWTVIDTNSTLASCISISCVNPSLPIFKMPVSITIPPNLIIQLYTRSGAIAEYAPSLNPTAILIGRQPDDNSHYSIASEGKHYLWGFTNPPSTMTQSGTDLFYNVVAYMCGIVRQPVLHVNTSWMSFGWMKVGTTKDTTVTITNNGNDTLRIDNITSSLASFAARPTSANIAPGQSSTDTLRFAPTSAGNESASIVILSNSGSSPDTITAVGRGIASSDVRAILELPTTFSLNQNFPNPFNPSTTIRYGLPDRSSVRIVITNVLGQQVATLENGEQEAGSYEVEWRANAASGMYFYRIDAVSSSDPNNRFVQVKKMLLLK